MDREQAERERMWRGPGRLLDSAKARPGAAEGQPTVGKRTLVEAAYPMAAPVQRAQNQVNAATDAEQVHASAQRGIATPTSPLPHADRLQRLFGRHDISMVKAHTGTDAAASARAMSAAAYATGDHVVLGEGADLHTVAHEVAHVVQQRGGVQFKDGVGSVGDPFEQHADAVADLVVRGQSAEGLLDEYAGPRAAVAGGSPVQRKVGFEFELAIPISPKGSHDGEPGQSVLHDELNASYEISPAGSVLAYSKTDPFHIQNDLGYSRIGQGTKPPEIGRSILEIVTAPVDEYAVDVEARLQETVGGAVEYATKVMALNPGSQRSPLPGGEGKYMVGYPKARVEGKDAFARGKLSPDAFIQINIGILPRALTEFHDFVQNNHTKLPEKQKQLESAIAYATEAAKLAMAAAMREKLIDPSRQDSVREEVTGFLVLVIDLLIGGQTTKLNHDKNIVPVLSKTDLHKLRNQALSPEARAALARPEILKYLIDAKLLPEATPKNKRNRTKEHYLFHDFGTYEDEVHPGQETELADLGNPTRESFAVNALQTPASQDDIDEIIDGFTVPTLVTSVIDPDELGPLEDRKSGPSTSKKSEDNERGPLGPVLEVRNNPGYHAPGQWLEIGRYWLDVARKMNTKRG